MPERNRSLRSIDRLITCARNQPTIVPARLVDRLSMLQLPAGQVRPASPCFDDVAPEAIGRNDAVGQLAVAQRVNQAALGCEPIASRALAISGAVAGKLRCVDAEEPKPNRPAAKRVAVNDIDGRARNDW